MSGASALQSLPYDIITVILSLVEKPSPIQQGLYDNAAKILNDDIGTRRRPTALPAPPPPPPPSANNDLKNASLLCRSWRDCALPNLFSHVLWKFQSLQRPAPGQDQEDVLAHLEELEWLRFLRRNDLTRLVKSLTIAITYPACDIGEDTTHHDRFGILPSHLVMPATRNHPPTPPNRDNNWLWRIIFDHIDPRTINLISSPAILASLLGRHIDLSGAWLFSQRFHILSLSRSPSSEVKVPLQEQVSPPGKPLSPHNIPCDLFSIRDWDSLLVNEGSSVPAYATYEYFNYTPPSLLPALLDSSDPSMFKLLRSLISLSYVAIFPFASHITNNLIQSIPSLDRFFIQIGPQDLNLADEPYRRSSIDVNDFWFERHTAYKKLSKAIFGSEPIGLWKDLRVFEYGDREDMKSWETSVRLFVHRKGTKWLVRGNGVIIRTDYRPKLSLPSPFPL